MVLGTHQDLNAFANKLRQVKTPDGRRFPKPISVNRGILNSIPDDEFRTLVENEKAKRPEPTAAHVSRAFESFLRSQLRKNASSSSPIWKCSLPITWN